MRKRGPFIWLGIASLIGLAWFMAGTIVFRRQVFEQKGDLTTPEVFMALGLILAALFMAASLIRLLRHGLGLGGGLMRRYGLAVLGLFCLALFGAEKVMIDEIAREQALGWHAGGEWLMLLAMLVVQWLYCLLAVRTLRQALPTGA